MSQKITLKKNCGYILQGLLVFTLMLIGVIAVYVVRDGGFHLEYSISRYVGREWWSAIIFALCNFAVMVLIWKYIVREWEKYGKVWVVLMMLVTICFIGLSFCPIGLFDATYGDYGVVSILHQIFARGMFMVMAVATAVEGWKRRGEKWQPLVCVAYVLYAVGCAVASATTQVFWDLNFVLETAYIYAFYAILMI